MSTSPIIETNYGRVQGLIKFTENSKLYHSFQGIPYAKQPIGEYRFRDPRPLEPWAGVLDASEEGTGCYHLDPFNKQGSVFLGSDECLDLNIYTPDLSPQKPLPVLVWVHGGGFFAGSSSTDLYGPDHLVERDVILVTFNYRLNVFGFLSFKDPKIGIPGNAGLKDQVMALRWVQENIAHFGGDANNVTLAGESAGGASVHYHLISPLSKGLFQRAIIMSGSAFNPWAVVLRYTQYEIKLARAMGYTDAKVEEDAFRIISSTEPQTLTMVSLSLLGDEEKLFDFGLWSPFLPTVEPYESDMCFLPKSPMELGRDAWSKDIDILIGGVSEEGLYYGKDLTPKNIDLIKNDLKVLLPFELRLDPAEVNLRSERMYKFYFKNNITENDVEIFQTYMGDKYFWHGINRFIRQRINCPGKTYMYYFAYEHSGDFQFSRNLRQFGQRSHYNGAGHGEDLTYIFKTSFDAQLPPEGSAARESLNKVVNLLTGFARDGKVGWKPLENEQELHGMILSDEWKEGPLPIQERMEFWDSLYPKYLLK